jgi:D-sedoheptulose 7-phosphate isomerase
MGFEGLIYSKQRWIKHGESMNNNKKSLDLINQRLRESISVKEKILSDDGLMIKLAKISCKIIDAIRQGHKVIFFGNGGSAADAQHLCAELVGKFYLERDPLPAISLTLNTSSITAIGNDFSFDEIFVKPLKALGQPGDIAIGISTSGNSKNVILAFDEAMHKKMITVAFTGETGGQLLGAVDYCLCIPSRDTARIQESHITIGHILCELVEEGLRQPGA